MRKRKHYDWCGSPKAMNERRQTQNCEYNRPKRASGLRYVLGRGRHNYCSDNSWKGKRKTQYRENGRGKRHELKLPESNWRQQCGLERYLREHDIPFRIEDLRETQVRERWTYSKRVPTNVVPRYCYKWGTITYADGKTSRYGQIISHQIGWEQKYRDIPLDKPKVVYYNVSVSAGWRAIWWSDKDIGIEHVLKRRSW